VFKFLGFEERFRQAPFSCQTGVVGTPNRKNKAAFPNFFQAWTEAIECWSGTFPWTKQQPTKLRTIVDQQRKNKALKIPRDL